MLFNLPNLLTLFRIAVIVPIVALFFFFEADWARWTAFGLYALACITDFFDGYVARQMNLVSPLGRFLDPIADKLLIAAIILLLVAVGGLSGAIVVPGLIILLREITVSGLREFLAGVRVGVPVSNLAKWKTTIQMLAFGFLLVGPASPAIIPSQLIGEVLVWLAAALTLVTAVDYLRAGLRHMTEE
ncbi:CDP-diacylglycerol--glycerol-3-phosphate 3-phosphatidyltransferase [Marivibrio halodurans]|uniref:CDP-diacylglycerol--glycerol-3-phosphate 3-phosphatidyltransferase n=1 Tax=Marivibrio halodurans TaxID=2039722 RepID=A0A8J7S110_9PROT|nr:CDP-diacylglycerol--glycerol-3-phosphate 3-phosphatidyltransferase [Marivibrio halodurans]MBP5856663.1 CDP-diacylglycerol--glycerol-3-phosphate 3-phosphatidyltransferase [Marivibrio halodurans]